MLIRLFVLPLFQIYVQIEEYFDNLPRSKVPKIGSSGERYREKQLLLQMPRQDLYQVGFMINRLYPEHSTLTVRRGGSGQWR